MIVNVHGGPFNLFRPEFNSVSQFLANRRYVVFEPNFRGSTGLGRDYLFAAKGDFGHGPLRTLNKDVSLFIDAESLHALPSPLTREAYLYLMEDMLHRHLECRGSVFAARNFAIVSVSHASARPCRSRLETTCHDRWGDVGPMSYPLVS